jgi:hypothetical protein
VSAASIEEAISKALEKSSPAIKLILPKRMRDAATSLATPPTAQREQR